MFAHSLIRILIQSGTAGTWDSPENRQALLGWLETGAACLEKFLPARLRGADPVTDAWMRERYKEMATGLRSLKKWVLLPRADTRAYFEARVLQTLREAARGDWDGLYREAPETLSRPQRLQILAGSIARAGRVLLAGSLPLLILTGLQRSGFALPPAIAASLTLGGIAWAAVTVLAWIDPDFKVKLDFLSTVRDLGKPGS
jgi:hypothetical protein